MSNTIHAIQMKLKQLSKSQKKNHQLTLTRYFQERLLYRLSKSEFRNNFFLKGGALVYALEQETSRPTLDIDLLAEKVRIDNQSISNIFQKVCSIEYPDDGIVFKTAEIETTEIVKEEKYSGIRVKIPVTLGKIKQRMQIDIGFGDTIVPAPILMDYPSLLGMEHPNIYAYSVESLVAEKFEAMIDLAELNSRMKDFYDIYKILRREGYDKAILEIAIATTIKQRETILPKEHPIFTEEFANDKSRGIQWKNFLRKTSLGEEISFSEVMSLIGIKLKPIYDTIQNQR